MKKLELIPFAFWLLTAAFAFSCNVVMTGVFALLLILSEVALFYVQFNRKW